jgi:hypothetical protein
MVSERCKISALSEHLAGTAPHRVAWLVIEESGAWPRDALADSPMWELPSIATHAAQYNIGALLMRRDRIRRDDRQVFLANRHELRMYRVPNLTEILDWDWGAIADGRLPSGGASHPSLTLVCVHGTRDQCCAIEGRAVLRDFADAPDIAECSHIGGHRFAPVVLHLPSGYLYGRVNAQDVQQILAGEVVPTVLRGCTYDPAAMQVAEQWLRTNQHLSSPTLFTPGDLEVQGDRATATLSTETQTWEVHLRSVETAPRAESCGSTPSVAQSWVVVG